MKIRLNFKHHCLTKKVNKIEAKNLTVRLFSVEVAGESDDDRLVIPRPVPSSTSGTLDDDDSKKNSQLAKKKRKRFE